MKPSPIVRVCAVAPLAVVALAGCASEPESSSATISETSWPPAGGAGPCHVSKETDVPATMRDGVVLRSDVYRPQTTDPVPVILMRTQYGKSSAQIAPERYQSPEWFASHCYLVVIQDVRGQGASSGVFSEFAPDMNDGYDSVEWAAALPGSTGKVGMYGSSYVGATQWLAATQRPPHLTTIIPANTASDYYDGWTYEGGEFRLGFVEPWAMGTIATTAAENRGDQATVDELTAAGADISRWLADRHYQTFPPMQPDNPAVAPWFFDWINHPTRDDYWKNISIRDKYSNVDVPVLDIEGWYDAFLQGGLENFTGMTSQGALPDTRQNQRIVIGPWDHLSWGRPDSTGSALLKAAGPGGNSPINDLMITWFDHYLKGETSSIGNSPRVDYFVMGSNTWKTAPTWPLPNTQFATYYLSGNGTFPTRQGTLTTTAPTQPQAPDPYLYDPENPTPSIGGHSCCAAASGPQDPFDQTPNEQRSDILLYDSPAFTQPTEMTGPITVDLYAQSSAPDTDFAAKIDVVKPTGEKINLNNGIIRAQLRDTLDQPEPLAPDQINEYSINVWPTSYELSPGDSIRVEISSADYPQFAANPNTGLPLGSSDATVRASQKIYHDGQHPSAVILPIITNPAAGTETFPQ
ncbi:CocE/NonD family hydrolase [Rhodococcus sp. OK302]|uniref:CocE/NonD family hydrolase n=1 Tax=Rhodococcus sp. OK302 TaxID=1882769 RepID=UPI000B93C0CE|nr:CocE/NonD family hydrolase [Rhodococcus sp. OK302]OYD67290.1 hypothetical protein BDB13_0804 [Rhodococcus sp. OK302]